MTDQQSLTQNKWQFWIDRGGTFTDIIARDPNGKLDTYKLLSENPEQYKDAAIHAIRHFLKTPDGESINFEDIDVVKMGTTVGTNALLERKGDPVVFVTTKGFHDSLRIGYQNRPSIFARNINLPEMLYQRIIEAEERVSAHGQTLTPLNEDKLRQDLQSAFDAGIKSCAIVFIHGYRYTDHETIAGNIAKDIGFEQISISHKTSPLMKMISRGDTTVADAYLSPILKRYVNQVSSELGDTKLMFMQSNGGLTSADLFEGKDCILSGPAGGIVGAVRVSEIAGYKNIIGFDMGGTSTDVAHYAGEYERSFETTVAGVRMRAPMMNIHTVAAGGGSICHFDGGRYRVGPESAGANPGPASYRRGGPLTVTDCNVMLGKLRPEFFPNVFGKNADEPLDFSIVEQKFNEMADKIHTETGNRRTAKEVAEGFLNIAVLNMARAVKQISVQRGYDVSDYTLTCFGGAGGQHACLVADALGMTTVLLHPYAGVLSAYGMGLADTRALREAAVEKILTIESLTSIKDDINTAIKQAQAELLKQDFTIQQISHNVKLYLRYEGTDKSESIDLGSYQELCDRFEQTYKKQYGFSMTDKRLIIEALSVEAVGVTGEGINENFPLSSATEAKSLSQVNVHMTNQNRDTAIYNRDDLPIGSIIDGPAIIQESTGTNIIEMGWQAEVTPLNYLVLKRIVPLNQQAAIGTANDGDAGADPVLLEVFNNLFMSIAEQMGLVLENTAYSVNIKERLDFSCAIFDTNGGLVANAPHMPVHLGSMGESIKAIIKTRTADVKNGDVYMLNDPYNGGTHLPDITVVTPVFNTDNKTVLFYVASRGHHADIGGITPGSMPPNSTNISQEGIRITDFHLVKQGDFQEQAVRDLFLNTEYPARNIDQNIADLRAQVAANKKGVIELMRMAENFGLKTVQNYMKYVQDNAEEQVRRVISTLNSGSFVQELDNGAEIRVNITIDKEKRSASVDFTGTSAQLNDCNFNAPSAICRAAVLYVFRTLVDDDIPMNEGCLKPIDIIIPKKSMLNPEAPAAVVAGNVETSQCITDALYGALNIMAASQGTMNNFTFGNDTHQYYETICGGSGAGNGFNGTDAVQTHMTNSRLTDPEILEWRFPVVLEEFSIRKNSGGIGAYNGGRGVVRRIRFEEQMVASILSNHRTIPPFGAEGGGDAECGICHVIRTDGTSEELNATDHRQMEKGDVFVIKTPGGGGYGKAV